MMGESDDEHDRRVREKNRSKFHGERQARRSERRSGSNYDERSCSVKSSSQREVSEDGHHRRKREYEYESRPRTSSRTHSPVSKRMHVTPASHCMTEQRGSIYVNPNFLYPPNHAQYYHQPPPYYQSYNNMERFTPGSSRPPPVESAKGLSTFKSFLLTQDDDITQDQARTKYDKYKQDFARTQLVEFFKEHRDEEWFKEKYHPDDRKRLQEEKRETVKLRLDLFMKYVAAYGLDEVVLDDGHFSMVNCFLERMTILMEGGTFKDLGAYDKTAGRTNLTAVKSKAQPQDKVATDSREVNGETEDSQTEDEEPLVPPVDKLENNLSDKPSKLPECDVKLPPASVSAGASSKEPSHSESLNEMKKSAQRLLELGSLFIRWVPPSITKVELEEMCGDLPGFMRLALADPTSDRRWQRRGWITFSSTDDILESCAVLNATRLHRGSLGVISNRPLSNKVRPLTSATGDIQALRHCANLAARLVYVMDCRHFLWDQEPFTENRPEQMVRLVRSKNPLLNNVLHHITEHASAEEDECNGVLGVDCEDGQVGGSAEKASSEEIAGLARFLDGLLLYLRVVHSVDFYRTCEYVNEHQMPHRLGIIHVRGPQSKVLMRPEDVTMYCEELDQNIHKTFLTPDKIIPEQELEELGLKDPGLEVDRFIVGHTTEINPKKWLFRLSGKKFQSPDYVRKHAFNKFSNDIEDVRKDAEYFNNYLRDVNRPKNCEPTNFTSGPQRDSTRRDYSTPSWQRGLGRAVRHPMMQPQYSPYYHPANNSYGMARGFRGNFNRSRQLPVGVTDMSGRPITDYRDLDLPREVDEM